MRTFFFSSEYFKYNYCHKLCLNQFIENELNARKFKPKGMGTIFF